MLGAKEHTEVKVARFDEGTDELRRIHELDVANTIVENDTKFLRTTAALLFNFFFLEFFDFVQGLDGFVHVREDAIRTDIQCFLYIIRLASGADEKNFVKVPMEEFFSGH